jgi:hypothetical protein
LASAPPTRAIEKLVAIGQIDSDGTVDLQPFDRVHTAFSSGAGITGEFSIELLGDKNEVLLEHRFDAQKNADGEAKAVGFMEFVPWHKGTTRILLKRNGLIVAERVVSQHAPSVRVLSPNGGEYLGTNTTITWEGSDPDGDPLNYTVLYNTGTDSTWWPIATGVTSNTINVDTSLWPGSAKGRVKVRVTDGVNTAEDLADDTFIVPQKQPMVAILNGEAREKTGLEAPMQLTAFAYDPEDGLLPETSFTWTSDQDGLLEPGRQMKLGSLSPGNHVITLTVTDSQGRTATAQVTKVIQRTPDKQPR